MRKIGGRRSRRTRIAALALALSATAGTAALGAAPAGADHGGSHGGELRFIAGQPPQSVIDTWDACPSAEEVHVPEIYELSLCGIVTVTHGDLKIGSKTAQITEPIEAIIPVAFLRPNAPPARSVTDAQNVAGSHILTSDAADFTPDLVGYRLNAAGESTRSIEAVLDERTVRVGGDPFRSSSPVGGRPMQVVYPLAYTATMPQGAPPAEIPISGGVLGLSILDPLLNLEPSMFRVLSLGATPEMGEVGSPREEAFALWLGGGGGESHGHQALRIPLAIRLNNILLGGECRIPEVILQPRTDTVTGVPAGVTPMTGDLGFGTNDWYVDDPANPTEAYGQEGVITGVKFVDNSFAVSGVTGCDGPLGLAKSLAFLTGGNQVEKLVNRQAGLPSPAGNNHVILDAEARMTSYYSFDPIGLAGR